MAPFERTTLQRVLLSASSGHLPSATSALVRDIFCCANIISAVQVEQFSGSWDFQRNRVRPPDGDVVWREAVVNVCWQLAEPEYADAAKWESRISKREEGRNDVSLRKIGDVSGYSSA
ncbi:unnamed protein product [Toxocara canis]|uniref:Uncharacterized protein n=1 Tax=Toxocara canis TaxID=6265 RepID=A0A183VAS6_TOXCA|nr:unnamed protein product [Toxocara canis]